MKKILKLIVVARTGTIGLPEDAPTVDLAAAVASGKVKVDFHGLGGSSGDSIEATITTTSKTGGDLPLTVAPGTCLNSGDAGAQNMVVASVRGMLVGGNSFSPGRVIHAGEHPTAYVFEAYCTDFDKNNPATTTKFQLGKVDSVLAGILGGSSSTVVKQVAVWIYTDKVGFDDVNAKFPVNRSEWDAATAIVNKFSASNKTPGKQTAP